MKRRILLIFDLNGTLLHRLTHDAEWQSFRALPLVVEQQLKNDLTVNGSKVILRPHIRSLFEALNAAGPFDIAFWTSARPKNAFPMVSQVTKGLFSLDSLLELGRKGYQLNQREMLLLWNERDPVAVAALQAQETAAKAPYTFLWTQSECDAIPNPATPYKPICRKNLDKVWEAFPGRFDPLNTIMIDDSPEKLTDHAENCLLVREFNVFSLPNFTQDATLLELQAYLLRMAASPVSDVRAYLKEHRGLNS